MESAPRSSSFLLGLAALYAIHLLVVAYVFPPRVVFAGVPYSGGDYQTHFHQTYRVAESMRTTGRSWGYEPQFLAGQPAGLIFDVDNKAHFLFSYSLSLLGLDLASAFNLFSLLSALIAPLVLVLAGRLFGLSPRAQLVVLALSTPTYFLDTACRFFTTAGMISYVMTAHLCLLVLVLFWRWLESPGRRGLRFFLPLLVLLPLAHLVHVWAFAILVGPMVILYLRAWRRRLPWTGHAQVVSLAGAVLAVNAYWLIPSFTHANLMTASIKLGQARPFYFILDLIEILPFMPPATVQTTLFRYLALAGAIVVVYRWRQAKDERTFAALTVLGWSFFLTYFSAYLPLFRLTEPYRFVLTLTFAAVVFASPFWSELLSPGVWREHFSGTAGVLAVLLLVLLLPQLGRQVLASAPELIPKPDQVTPQFDPPPWDRAPPPPMEITLRMKSLAPDFTEVADFVRRRCTEPGRILVEPWELGEFLGWATEHHVIGGFPDRRLVYEAANLFRDPPDHRRYWGPELADYLVRYNIRYLVIHLPIFPMIEGRRDLVELMARLGPYRIYRTRHRGGFFLRGAGRVRTSLNHIVLEDVRPDPRDGTVAIRFHYLKTLRCRPSCRLVKEPISDSDASFIGVVGDPSLASTITLEHRP